MLHMYLFWRSSMTRPRTFWLIIFGEIFYFSFCVWTNVHPKLDQISIKAVFILTKFLEDNSIYFKIRNLICEFYKADELSHNIFPNIHFKSRDLSH